MTIIMLQKKYNELCGSCNGNRMLGLHNLVRLLTD